MNRQKCRELLSVPPADANLADALRMLSECMQVIEDMIFGEENFAAAERLLERWEPIAVVLASAQAGVMSEDPEAWREGLHAGQHGKVGPCPYSPLAAKAQARSWARGYFEGLAEHMGSDQGLMEAMDVC